jgi:hypothetical protein
MEGSLVAYKVFTNGSVLNASEINDNLMNQSVMVFSNSAARSAALPSPLAGMLTFLEDTGLYSSWNGSAWVALDVSLISSNTFTGSSSVNIDGVFSSNFQNYNIVVYAIASGALASISMQYRAGGVNETATQYYYGATGVGAWDSLALFSVNRNIRANIPVGDTDNVAGMSAQIDVFNPNTISKATALVHSAGAYMTTSGTILNTSTQYTGFRLFPSAGTITGTVRIYGLRN